MTFVHSNVNNNCQVTFRNEDSSTGHGICCHETAREMEEETTLEETAARADQV